MPYGPTRGAKYIPIRHVGKRKRGHGCVKREGRGVGVGWGERLNRRKVISLRKIKPIAKVLILH